MGGIGLSYSYSGGALSVNPEVAFGAVLVVPMTKVIDGALAVTTDLGSNILSYGSSKMSQGADELNKIADDMSSYVPKGSQYEGTRNPQNDFINGKGESTLKNHAGRHSNLSPEEYLNSARNFLEKSVTNTTQSFVSEGGSYFRYDFATNEFGIINKYGGISTYFQPKDGIAYWLKQIELYAPK